MVYLTLNKKAIIIENVNQARTFARICKEIGILRKRHNSANILFPYYETLSSTLAGDIVSVMSQPKTVEDKTSPMKLGYFPLTINQFEAAAKEIYEKDF